MTQLYQTVEARGIGLFESPTGIAVRGKLYCVMLGACFTLPSWSGRKRALCDSHRYWQDPEPDLQHPAVAARPY